MKLRLKMVGTPDIQEGQFFIAAVKVLEKLDENHMVTIQGPSRLEYLDDESGQWTPIPIDSTDLESIQTQDIRELSS